MNIEFKDINPSFCINARVRKLHKTIDGIYQAQLKPFNLKGSMLSILFVTGKKPGINQKGLSDLLVLDQSTISRDLKKLASQNRIEIKKGTDPRNKELFLTTEGLQLVNEIAPVWHATHQQVELIMGNSNLNQLDEMITLMQKSTLESTKKTTL